MLIDRRSLLALLASAPLWQTLGSVRDTFPADPEDGTLYVRDPDWYCYEEGRWRRVDETIAALDERGRVLVLLNLGEHGDALRTGVWTSIAARGLVTTLGPLAGTVRVALDASARCVTADSVRVTFTSYNYTPL